MGKTVQDKTSNVTFTTLQRGKGYVAEEVNTYIDTVRKAYMVLEAEHAAVAKENAQMKLRLDQVNDDGVENTANYIQRISELTRKLEEQERLLKELNNKNAGENRENDMPQIAELQNALAMLKEQHSRELEINAAAVSRAEQRLSEMAERLKATEADKNQLQQKIIELENTTGAPKNPEEMDTVDLAAHFLSILETGQAAADRYSTDKQQQIELLQTKSTHEAEETLRNARTQAAEIIRAAERQAEEIRSTAQKELAENHALIERACAEYRAAGVTKVQNGQ